MRASALLALLVLLGCAAPSPVPDVDQEIALFVPSSEDLEALMSQVEKEGESGTFVFSITADYPGGTVRILATDRLDWPMANGTLTIKFNGNADEYAARTAVTSTGRLEKDLARSSGGES